MVVTALKVMMSARRVLLGACLSMLVGASAFAVDLPSKAKQLKGAFVTAYDACSAPTTFMNQPFALTACTPVRTNPLCGFGPSGTGKYSAKVNGSDVAVNASWTGLDIGCEGTTLYLVTDLRVTTSDCAGGDCTMIDLSPFNLGQCTVSLGRCTIKSTLESFIGYGPEVFKAGQTYSVEMGNICAYSLIGSANAFCSGVKIAAP
jgi:hypothetical protein